MKKTTTKFTISDAVVQKESAFIEYANSVLPPFFPLQRVRNRLKGAGRK